MVPTEFVSDILLKSYFLPSLTSKISDSQEYSLSFLWCNTFCCAALFSFEIKWTESGYSSSDLSSISPLGNQLLFWRGHLSEKRKTRTKKRKGKPHIKNPMDRKAKTHGLWQVASYSHLWVIYTSSWYNTPGKLDYKFLPFLWMLCTCNM